MFIEIGEIQLQFHFFSLETFSLPIENESDDEYVRAAQSTEEDCDSIYSENCRFSVLGLLLSKDRPILWNRIVIIEKLFN